MCLILSFSLWSSVSWVMHSCPEACTRHVRYEAMTNYVGVILSVIANLYSIAAYWHNRINWHWHNRINWHWSNRLNRHWHNRINWYRHTRINWHWHNRIIGHWHNRINSNSQFIFVQEPDSHTAESWSTVSMQHDCQYFCEVQIKN